MKKSYVITLAIFFGVLLIYVIHNLVTTEGFFSYLLDDAYIHLSIAKNFAIYDVWGITKYEFSSTSSSPLFTIIISFLIYIFGDDHMIPLLFNLVAMGFCIYFLDSYFSRYLSSRKLIITGSLLALFAAVLHLQVLAGMEHVLQVLLLIVNISYLQRWIDSNFKNYNTAYWFFFSLSLMGIVRFESMFYFAGLAFVLLIAKKYKGSFFTLLIGFLPVALFCYFNYKASGYMFPFSVVVKGSQLSLNGDISEQLNFLLFKKFLLNRSFYKIGLFPIIIVLCFFIKDFRRKNFRFAVNNNIVNSSLVITMILHAVFADLRGFFRYEAYLMVGFVMALFPRVVEEFHGYNLKKLMKPSALHWSAIIFVIITVYKFGFGHLMVWNGGRCIYEQQIQSAKFLKEYYNNSKIVANDIGAIAYFTDIRLLDTEGLGSKVILPYTQNNQAKGEEYGRFISSFTQKNKYEVAIIYDQWLSPYIPKEWTKVAKLKIENNYAAAYDHVFVYSIIPKNTHQMRSNIRNFNWNKNVKVEIFE